MQTDREILWALQERAPKPIAARELADASGISLERLQTRMKSLVSLRYVECVSGDGADAYVLPPNAARLSDAPERPPTTITVVNPRLSVLQSDLGHSPRQRGSESA